MSHGSIVKARDYLTKLRSEYPGVEIPFYMFREWYGAERKIFFDCENGDLEACRDERLGFKQFSYFRVFFIVRSEEGYAVKGISYPNIGNSSLESWVPRFEKNLKPSTLMSLSASGSELVDEIGFSYRT